MFVSADVKAILVAMSAALCDSNRCDLKSLRFRVAIWASRVSLGALKTISAVGQGRHVTKFSTTAGNDF